MYSHINTFVHSKIYIKLFKHIDRLPVHRAAFLVAEGSVWLTPVVLVVYPALLPCLVAGNSSPMFRGGALGTECLDGCCGHNELLEISHSESKC